MLQKSETLRQKTGKSSMNRQFMKRRPSELKPRNVHRMSLEIDKDEFKYIKMCCAKLGTSLVSFFTEAIREKVEEWEDKWYIEKRIEEGTWDRKSKIEERKGGKLFCVYEDGSEEELIGFEEAEQQLQSNG